MGEKLGPLAYRKLLWITLACSTLALLLTLWSIRVLDANPKGFPYAWRATMIAVVVSLLIMAVSRFSYLRRLQQIERALTAELEATRHRVVRAAAHELRNPMAGLKGVVALLRRRLAAGRPLSELLEMLDIAESEADRATVFLNDFIDAFRIQQGRLEIEPAPVDLVQVMLAALKPYMPAIEHGNRHHLVIEGTELTSALVLGDALRLEQVVRNLLSNALQYSPQGGEVRICLEVDDGKALLTVEDHGLGIPSDEVPHIFECFHRAGSTAEHDPGGTGLGLYVARHIVEQHHGRIWAQSTEGEGTTLFVELPLCESETPAGLEEGDLA